jgi:predicted nucleic-acid-binding protein
VIALDTNVIVRLVTADDPSQLRTARILFQSGLLWVCKTVLLETEWVLRYSYDLDRDAIQTVFHRLLGYPHLQVEDRVAVIRALALHGLGMDFADALHLASSGDADRFATFDRPLAKAAHGLGESPVVDLLGPTDL